MKYGYGIGVETSDGRRISLDVTPVRHGQIPKVAVLEHLHHYAYVFVESKAEWQWLCRCGRPKPCA